MKRAVRWIGIGITAAAAATMLLADVALANAVSADGPRGGAATQAVRQSAPFAMWQAGHDAVAHGRGNPTMTIVEIDQRTEYRSKTFVPLD